MKTVYFSRRLVNLSKLLILSSFFFSLALINSCKKTAYKIENPYANVNWASYGQYKANLHTHTSVGEAEATPEVVIDLYKELGYSILAITDHDDDVTAETTWPWQKYQRDPVAINMVAIEGNEISALDDIGSYFNDYGEPDLKTEEDALKAIGEHGGLVVFNHPGRYKRSVEWYADFYRRYPHLIGLEVYNKRDRYPGDREKWDAILMELLPERSVWGTANDDMHKPPGDLGYSWNVFILEDLTNELVQKAFENGCFFFVHSPKGHDGPQAPVIKSIKIDEQNRIIEIIAVNYENIVWISQGKIIQQGNKFNLKSIKVLPNYVRAEVYGEEGTVVGTQPFSIRVVRANGVPSYCEK